MTECLGRVGGLARGWGWTAGKEEGQRLSWFCTDKSLHFPDWKSCLGCAHLHRVTVFTMLPGSTDFFLSFSQTQLVFFIARVEQTVGALPPRWVKKHVRVTQKAQLTWAAGVGGVACCRDIDPCLHKQGLPLGGV